MGESLLGSFRKQRVGNAELIALQDAWTTVSPESHFPSVPPDAWNKYRDGLDEDGNLIHNFGCWLIRSKGNTILVDTGLGNRGDHRPVVSPPSLPSVMEAAGVKAVDVDIVVFTHLHFDHTGWNTTGDGDAVRPVFPNARHVVQRTELEFWTGDRERPPHGSAYDVVLAPIENAGLLDVVEEDYALTSEVVTVPTPGHTPGHVSLAIVSGGEHAYILGDVAHKPVQLTETDWCPIQDFQPALATRSRRALFDRIERENALIAAGHFPFPGMGYARREDGVRVFASIP